MKKQLANPIYFQVVMIVITFMTSCAYLRIKLGNISYVGLTIGFLFCLFSLFDGTLKKVLADKTNLLLIAFCIFYLITIALSYKSQFVTNIKQWIYMCLFFYVLTVINRISKRELCIKNLRIVSYIYCIVSFIIALVSFYMFVTEFSYYAQDPDTNLWYGMGMYGRRLAGLYNSNTSASIFAVSIIISIFLFIDAKNDDGRSSTLKKAFNIINSFLQFCCLVLTASRGALYSFYLAVFVVTFLIFNRVDKKNSGLRRYIIVITIAAFMVFVFFGIEEVTKLGLEYVPGLVNNQSEVISFLNTPNLLNIEKVELDREYSTITTGRAGIWKASFGIIKDNFLFGIPYESLNDLASSYLADNGVSTDYLNAGGTFHNIVISCLVSSGILGFIPIVSFILIRLIDAIKFAFKNKEYRLIELLPLIIVIMALCNEMVESRILYSVNILNVVFWTMMGYLPSYKKVTNET